MLYLEKELPPPGREPDESYLREGLGRIKDLITASEGRALVLFTSYRHLRFVSENIDIAYPFRTQGDMPATKLVQWFRTTPGSVLLATATFWQGIDVKGEKLSLVIIAKLPFGSPGDPVYDERCKRLGGKWFNGLALPSAILLLRQGFGRLIRGAEDSGVIAILDSRVAAAPYGKTIVSSLPEMQITHDIGDVRRFFRSLRREGGE
jgi:ATP-dependent DNA helicase DinG